MLEVVKISGEHTYVQRKIKERGGVVREWIDVPLHYTRSDPRQLNEVQSPLVPCQLEGI
jgi:hypothetical protein